ncbi:MAG: TIGR00159 family protein [Anaerolineaceae bacterium 4572_5.1]|nr:MAG: TIGR00159 family protein [Anaerolineaceae bacterium 4572_5.1]
MIVLNNLIDYLVFIFERLDWISIIDILLVTIVFFFILYLLRDTKAMVLLRGILFLIVVISLITSLRVLPAFSWLVANTLPALLLAIPVIFAPEIRRALERIGRTGGLRSRSEHISGIEGAIQAITIASRRISKHRYGGLIILQRLDSLQEFIETGISLDSYVTPELLIQIFYPKTPLHDGAVIISGEKIAAAGCVMPLSSSGVLDTSPERPMGLRHRAALGTAEASDAIAIVISEETGIVSLAYDSKIIRHVALDELNEALLEFYLPLQSGGLFKSFFSHIFSVFEGIF